MATQTDIQIGEAAWLGLTQSQQLDLFKELIMERVQLGELLTVANKSLDHLRTDVTGTMNHNAELVTTMERQRKQLDGQAVELDRMERLLGDRVGH